MKKLLYCVLVIFLSSAAFSTYAQHINLNPRVKMVEGKTDGDEPHEANVVITNNAVSPGDTMIKWTIIECTKPTAWQFDFCDPIDCIVNLGTGATGTFKMPVNGTGSLKGAFYANDIGGNSTVKIVLEYVNGTSNSDTVTFLAKGWSTGVHNVKKQAEVSFFPNPAKDLITFKYSTNKPVEVSIYNILGSKVKSFTHNGPETQLNIGDLQKGMYFIRFNDGNNVVSKSFTKAD